MGHSAFSVFRGCRPSRDRSSDGVRDFSSKGKSTRKKVLQCIFHPFLFYILHVLRLCLHGLSPFLLGHLLWQITVVGHGINYASTMDGRHHADSIAVRDFFETLSLTSAQCLFFLFPGYFGFVFIFCYSLTITYVLLQYRLLDKCMHRTVH